MKRSRRAASFIAVLPASLLLSCGAPRRTQNPPPPTYNPPASEPTPSKNPPDPGFPPPSYGSRVEQGGECTVHVSGNPPYQEPVSCTAPIEPPPEGEEWCRVESREDPTKKVMVACEEKE